MKIYCLTGFLTEKTTLKWGRIMRLTLFLMVGFLLTASANSYSQSTRLDIKLRNGTIAELIKHVEDNSEFVFLYKDEDLDLRKKISVSLEEATIGEVLDVALSEQNMEWDVYDRQIVLRKSISAGDKLQTIQQQRTITGTVTDQRGEPLPGVTVMLAGTTTGTVTTSDGNFTLNIPDDSETLQFSFVGMRTQEIPIDGRTTFTVVMEEDIVGIEEVIAVGYGTQRKVNLTGSVDAINTEQIISRPVGQASMALQGLAPGVTVTQSSGKPGSDGGTIRIRGIGTIGDSNPLVLVDGIPGNINDLDISEIDNISILKDAASASIYGSRAANGVILVTTKRAKDNQFRINYRASAGWQQPTALMEKVSGYDHMVMINEAYKNVGRTPPYSNEYVEAYKINAPSDDYPETNWHDEMVKEQAFQQNHYIGVNGGGEKIKMLGSVSYWDQDGILHSNYQRLNIRLNTDVNLKDNLNLGFDMSYNNDGNSEPPQVWYWLARYPHNLAGKNENGTWGIGWDGSNGWADLVDGGYSDTKNNDMLANIKINWEPLDGLNFMFQVAPEKSINHYKSFRKHTNLYYPDGNVINPSEFKARLTERYIKSVTNNYKFLFNYSKDIKEHSLSVLGGWEAIDYRREWIQGYREQYPLEKYEVLNVGSQINQEATGSAAEWSLMSYFGRLNYNFKEKLLLEANMRIDGSSRFAEDYQFGVFPSVSAGWRVFDEPYLKLRASWGKLGNQNIGNYPFASSVTLGQNYVFGGMPVIGAALLDGANPKISWEKTEILNFGIDANIWKLNLTADYYIKKTSDILLRLPIPQVAGLSAPYQNAGTVKNEGWDARVAYSSRAKKFNYQIGFTLADVKNEIVDLVGTGPYIYSRTAQIEGYPIDALFGLEALGLFQDAADVENHASQFGAVQPGDIKYKDQLTIDTNGDGIPDEADGVVNAQDRVVIGSTIPRYTYSFDYSCSYKGFDFGIFFQGVGKRDGYLDNFATMAFYLGGTAQEWHKDYWREDNLNASYPRLTFNYPNNEQVTSYWIKSAAYLRLKNLQVGYSLPKSVLDKSFVNNFRFFFSGQNLFTFDNFYHSYDPEAPVGQGDYYPMVKVFSFGIETTF
jgi:TonB-linked SusC/RagA family outer membrane protein